MRRAKTRLMTSVPLSYSLPLDGNTIFWSPYTSHTGVGSMQKFARFESLAKCLRCIEPHHIAIVGPSLMKKLSSLLPILQRILSMDTENLFFICKKRTNKKSRFCCQTRWSDALHYVEPVRAKLGITFTTPCGWSYFGWRNLSIHYILKA
jgi:hypothetical protein